MSVFTQGIGIVIEDSFLLAYDYPRGELKSLVGYFRKGTVYLILSGAGFV